MRYAQIAGRRYKVSSEDQERTLLVRHAREQRSRLETEEKKPETEARAAQIKRLRAQVVRAKNRVEKINKREEDELVALLAAINPPDKQLETLTEDELLVVLEALNG